MVILASVRDERGLTVSAVSQQIDPLAHGIKQPTRRPEPRPALMAGNGMIGNDLAPTAQGYAWQDGQTATVNWVTEDKRAALKLEPKTNADAVVHLDHLHAVVRWMHGRPNYRLTVWAKGQAPATLWMGFKGQGFEEGQSVDLTAEWKAYEFTARLEGARRFTLVPMFKLPAGKAAAPVWIADIAVEVSP